MSHLRVLVTFIALLTVAACGSGGADPAPGPGAPAPLQLAFLKAVLLGSLETVVVDADAQGTIVIDIRDDGQLEYGCAAQADWVADITAMHIHRGAAGVDGPIEVNLLGGGASFDVGTLAAADTLMIDPALAAEIAASPGDFYVNVHTGAAPGGLVRQQLEAIPGLETLSTLLGTNEVPVVSPDARGAITVTVLPDHTVQYTIALQAPLVGNVVGAHIHDGAAGVNGPICVDLETASATVDAAANTITGTVTASLADIARVCNALDQFYVNVHTSAWPSGEVRGQLGPGPVEFWAPLEASEEVTPPTIANARGGVALHFDTLTSGRAHLAVPPAQGITSVTGAHVHQGPPGVDGPIVIDLQAGADYVASTVSFSAEGAITCTADLLARMIANPAAFYVNFHTAADPTGVARGQLSQDPVSFFTNLDGANEVPPVTPAGVGTFTMVATGMFECSFTVNMTTPAAGTVDNGHIHDAAAGANGPVLIDLIGGTDVMVSGTFITGNAGFLGRTLSRLLAVPERFYANMHTPTEPGGVARGQLIRQTEDAPPAGLTYSSPTASYPEGTAITNNVPTSIGGAITSYSLNKGLPTGLAFNGTTGVISGTPCGEAAADDYTITAFNAAGNTSTMVNITVTAVAPTNLSYTSPVTYTVGTAIAANNPTNTGGKITTYMVSPALPAGLTLNADGSITGTPTSAAAQATYTVTGSNSAGMTTFGISITVNASLTAPSGLSYTTPVTYTTGTAITPNTPTVGGGAVSTWSVSPALPAGLSLSATTGAISGTPTQITAQANYTVTASNAAGSDMATVSITVNLGAPTNLSYSPSGNVGYTNTAITQMNPSSSGGAVSSYSITPALPAGITLNTTSGVISGTPTVTSGQTTYTITATNAAGNTTTTISIIVY